MTCFTTRLSFYFFQFVIFERGVYKSKGMWCCWVWMRSILYIIYKKTWVSHASCFGAVFFWQFDARKPPPPVSCPVSFWRRICFLSASSLSLSPEGGTCHLSRGAFSRRRCLFNLRSFFLVSSYSKWDSPSLFFTMSFVSSTDHLRRSSRISDVAYRQRTTWSLPEIVSVV